jgi:hypothetical protein
MSDNDTPDENETPEQEADNLRALREAAASGKSAQAEAAAARKELAFVKAGIDTDAGVGKLLLQQFDGEPTKEAVLAAAAEYGITVGTPEPAEVEIPADEQAQTRERAALATGAEVPGGTPDPDPYAAGYAEYNQLRETGVPLADAADAVIGRVFEAAYLHKDPRVLHNQAAYEAANRGSARPS